MAESIHIIGEAGTNHNGSYETARQLVDVAVEAKADSIKFQIIYPEGLYLPRLFQNGVYQDNEVFAIRAANALTDGEYQGLAAYCAESDIPFTASIFDRQGLDLLDDLDVPYIKTASCDLNNSPFLMEVAERGRRMIISTGMATLGEIDRAVSDVVSKGNDNIVLLHCVSIYPAPVERMNLGFIRTLQQAFGFPVGLSDHTESTLAASVAVAMGVSWIEKHFTLDRTSKGFDHAYAMEPQSFADYIKDVRATELACASRAQKVGETEETVRLRARRGLFAARDMALDETFAPEDVLIVRPEAPLRPNDLPLVLGRKARREVHQYEPITLEMLG